LTGGRSYVDVAAGPYHVIARRSDGTVVAWGRNTEGQCVVPPLPMGVTYVQLSGGGWFGAGFSVARRSDGTVVGWGANSLGQVDMGTPPPSMSFVDLDAGVSSTVTVLGSPTTYTFLGAGCGGSMSPTMLVPIDTPRSGGILEIRLLDLPISVAFMMTGFRTTSSSLGPLPLTLAGFGMPGCTAFVSDDLVTMVTGSGGQAVFTLAIPTGAFVVGAMLHQQALVLDPGANVLGAVMSNAATGVIGH